MSVFSKLEYDGMFSLDMTGCTIFDAYESKAGHGDQR